jgi:hypothetical protein
MGVTVYRCERCLGVFQSVFGVGGKNYCRNCRFNLNTEYVPGEQGSGGVAAGGGITIVEPKEETVGGGKAGAAIGGQQQAIDLQINALAQKSLSMLGGGQQSFSGGSEIRSPFMYAVPDDPKYKFKFTERNIEPIANLLPGQTFVSTDGVTRLITSVQRLDDTRVMVTDSVGVFAVLDVPRSAGPVAYAPPPKPEPESSPHDAILKPSRKFKLAAE